jgi:hypothetical protein
VADILGSVVHLLLSPLGNTATSTAPGEIMADKLFKAYVKTLDHPHLLEMIVSAPDAEIAAKKALKHVKEANPDKGRALEVSQQNSEVIAVKVAGKNGCIVTNKLPLVIFNKISKNIENRKGKGEDE